MKIFLNADSEMDDVSREWRAPDIQWMSVWHGPERSGERIYDVVDARSGEFGKRH